MVAKVQVQGLVVLLVVVLAQGTVPEDVAADVHHRVVLDVLLLVAPVVLQHVLEPPNNLATLVQTPVYNHAPIHVQKHALIVVQILAVQHVIVHALVYVWVAVVVLVAALVLV